MSAVGVPEQEAECDGGNGDHGDAPQLGCDVVSEQEAGNDYRKRGETDLEHQVYIRAVSASGDKACTA
jgi:hypothetical protein